MLMICCTLKEGWPLEVLQINKFGTNYSMQQKPFGWYCESSTSTAGHCTHGQQLGQKTNSHMDLFATASNMVLSYIQRTGVNCSQHTQLETLLNSNYTEG